MVASLLLQFWRGGHNSKTPGSQKRVLFASPPGVYTKSCRESAIYNRVKDRAPGNSREKAPALQTIHTHDSRLSLQHSPLGNHTGKNPGGL